jgi:hypothetical protein
VRAPEVDVAGQLQGPSAPQRTISAIPTGPAQIYSKCPPLTVFFRPQFKLFVAQIEEALATLSE